MLEHHRASAVAEQDAGAAISPVDDPRHHVRSDDQDVAEHAGLDELRPDDQPIPKRGASRPHVERTGPWGPQRLLNQRARGREARMIGRTGRDDDQIEVGSVQAGHRQRVPRGRDGHRAGSLVGRRDPPLHNPGPLANPLV